MNIEIKFRGKRQNGEFIYATLDEIIKVPRIRIEFERSKIKDLYTGLKDKNGKKIFEGDIVKEEGVVIYKDCSFQTDNYPLMNFFIEGMEDKKSKLEIIGNVHENPELLKGD